MTGSDPSGMMKFLTDQLQEAEDTNDRGRSIVLFVLELITWILIIIISVVWIMGHVPSGWSGQDPLLNPSNLCKIH